MKKKFFKTISYEKFHENFPFWISSHIHPIIVKRKKPIKCWDEINNSKILKKFKMELIAYKGSKKLRAIRFKSEKHYTLFCLSYEKIPREIL